MNSGRTQPSESVTGRAGIGTGGAQKIIQLKPVLEISKEESGELAKCEETIRARLKSFFEVGEALLKIKDKKLYRADFSTFEAYCRSRWDFSRIHAYQLLHAAEIRTKLLPISGDLLPENERQIRPLVGLPEKLAEKAWLKAVELADGHTPTNKTVARAVNLISKPKGKGSPHQDSWQIDLRKLLKRALASCNAGDRDALADVLYRINLRLEIGSHKSIHTDTD